MLTLLIHNIFMTKKVFSLNLKFWVINNYIYEHQESTIIFCGGGTETGTRVHDTFLISLLSCLPIGFLLIYSNWVHIYDFKVKLEAKRNLTSHHVNHNERRTTLMLPPKSIMVLLHFRVGLNPMWIIDTSPHRVQSTMGIHLALGLRVNLPWLESTNIPLRYHLRNLP